MSSSSVDIDGNVWYQVIESRVDFNSSMAIANGIQFIAASSSAKMYWQFYKMDNGNYALRNQATSIRQQLGTCYVAKEVSSSKTQPCMVESDGGDESQEWVITNWGDDTYKLTNAKNGTGYNLDWHPGNPGFMNPTTASTPYQPAQHWKWSSLATINDGAFSTPMAALASSTSSPTTTTGTSRATTTGTSGAISTSSASSAVPGSSTATPTSDASTANSQKSSGLSAGAGAGIGVGVAVLVIAAIAGLIFLILRRRRNQKIPENATELDAPVDGHQNWPVYAKEVPKEAPGHAISHEMYTPPAELAGNEGPRYQSPDYHTPGKR
ncbi:hypothetical protein FKW77_005935 [Venturia effusa]|uniref:Ricin B lectin domain-containing protein n=1 Tax=Venturia effusa TaxID=50376 RepID=A0A517LIV1_9PEZI|nr:hypothetical protein FKW77_005935 [Venturia effusa]